MTKDELGDLIIDSQTTLYNISKSILYNDDDCSDAIQETIAKAFDKIHTLKKPEFAKTWLTRILINECYSILNRKKRVISIHEVEDSLSTENKADYSELYEALMTLPTDIRVAIILYYMEGYKIKEIASLQNTTESAVKKRLVRGRSKLRENLEGGMLYESS